METILITGASSGIGRATAEMLAEQGHTVIVHGRDAARTQAAAAEIQQATGNANIHTALADLSSQAAVRQLADDIGARFPRLTVLLHNAGVIARQHTLTPDGVELQLAVNHLAPFLLTHQLLPVLRASTPARIVVVSSGAHSIATLDFNDLNASRDYHPVAQYGRTKLMNILFTNELSQRLVGTGITANSLHPGVIETNLMYSYFGTQPGQSVGFPTRSLREGADTSVYLATSPEVAGITGQYFSNRQPDTPSAAAQDATLAARLWQRSAELTGVAE